MSNATVISVRLTPVTHAALRSLAEQAQVPVSSYVRKVLVDHVAQGRSAYAIKDGR